jgi:hypothetical protein
MKTGGSPLSARIGQRPAIAAGFTKGPGWLRGYPGITLVERRMAVFRYTSASRIITGNRYPAHISREKNT